MIEEIKKDFKNAQELLESFIQDDHNWEKIEKAGIIMVQSLKAGNKIISCGNGGSLCDAVHFAEELTGRFHNDRSALPAIAISDPGHITCVANDFGFEYIFSRAIEALGKPNDVLLAITTSGTSKNIINAAATAKKNNMSVVSLTGKSGGVLSAVSDVEICVPMSDYSDHTQEIHMVIIHALVHIIELSLFNNIKKI
jgi:D-sedoheptulose 7-phosphate isomerase